MKHAKDLVKNTAIIGIGNLGTKIISFLLLPLYTTLLSASDYGIYDLLTTIATFVVPVVTILMEESMFRFLIDCKNDSEKKRVISQTALIILVGVTVFSLVYVSISVIFAFKYKLLLYLYILSSIILAFRNSYFRGIGKIKIFAIINLCTSVAVILINILTIAISGLLLSRIIAGFVSLLILAPTLKHNINIKDVSKKSTILMIKYSVPLIPNSISWSIINTSDRIAVSAFIGDSANGIYSIANKFPAIVDTMYSFFYVAWKESAAKTVKDDNSSKFYNSIYGYLKQFMFSVVLAFVALMPFVFNILVKNDFSESYVYMPILFVAIFFANISGYYGGIFAAYKNTKIMGITTLASAIINIVVDLSLINILGIWAAAISTLVATLFMYISRKITIKKYVRLEERHILNILNFPMLAVVVLAYYQGNKLIQLLAALLVIIYCFATNREVIKKALATIKIKIKKDR